MNIITANKLMDHIVDDSVHMKSNDEFYKGIQKRSSTINRIDYKVTNRNGGYITYIRMLPQLIPLVGDGYNLFKSGAKLLKFPRLAMLGFYLSMVWVIISFIFQLIFKPLLWIFKKKTRYVGCYEVGGVYGLRNQTVVKYVTRYFIGIPFAHYRSTLTNDDWDYIQK